MIGSGAMGLPAAIVAREAGSSVIVVKAEKGIGGHAITKGGNVPLGGGTSVQKKYGIADSPDLLFRDLTDGRWSSPTVRRITATTTAGSFVRSPNSPQRFEWLAAHGVVFVDQAPDGLRINARCQVIEMNGHVIPGLYCGGESAGGFSQHVLARAACKGYIAGRTATREK